MDMDVILEQAAASPDPVVRRHAIKYRQMLAEKGSLDSFFSFYGAELGGSVPKADAAVKTDAVAKVKRGGPQARTGRGARQEEFAEMLRETLIAVGKPLKLSHLFTAYYEKHADAAKYEPGSFRQKVLKTKIGSVEGRGYWPTDVALPSEA